MYLFSLTAFKIFFITGFKESVICFGVVLLSLLLGFLEFLGSVSLLCLCGVWKIFRHFFKYLLPPAPPAFDYTRGLFEIVLHLSAFL